MGANPVRRSVERARLAGIVSRCGADSPRAAEARRDYGLLVVEQHLRQLVAGPAPLTATQEDQLISIIRPNAVMAS